MQSHTKPLFIPLKREYFEQFRDGSKSIEYRRAGGQWCDKHVYPGRAVILSLGYGKSARMTAVVELLETRVMDTDVYGPGVLIACIHLRDIKQP